MTLTSAPSVLITGATRGLGLAAARAAARQGARVIVAGRDDRAVRALADELGARRSCSTSRRWRPPAPRWRRSARSTWPWRTPVCR